MSALDVLMRLQSKAEHDELLHNLVSEYCMVKPPKDLKVRTLLLLICAFGCLMCQTSSFLIRWCSYLVSIKARSHVIVFPFV